MSQTLEPQPDLRQELSRKKTDIDSYATFLTFEPGLYAIDFRSAVGSMSDVGLPLPSARLEPVVSPVSPGRAFISTLPEGGWLSRTTSAAHILVVGGRAGAVLTIFRSTDGMPMPEVAFRAVMARPNGAGRPGVSPPPASAELPVPEAAATLVVHVEGLGDRRDRSSEWVGDLSGQRAIEGFALTLPAGMAVSDVEYQGIMGEDWRTPWFEAGAFCGSRGLQLPLLGFRLRLVGAAAIQFECRAWGQFARHGTVGPVASGEDCHADNMPMTAMKVEIVAKPTPAPEPIAEEEAPAAVVEPPAKKPRWRRPKS